MAEHLGLLAATAWHRGWLDRPAKTQSVSESAAVVAGSDRLSSSRLKKKCYHSCCTDLVRESKLEKVLMVCKFWAQWAVTTDFYLFHENGILMYFCDHFARTCERTNQQSSLRSTFWPLIGLQVKIRQNNQSANSELNPAAGPARLRQQHI